MERLTLILGRILLVLGAAAGGAALLVADPVSGWIALVAAAILGMVIGLVVNSVCAALLPLGAWLAYATLAGASAFGDDATRTLTLVLAVTLTLFLLAGVWVRRMKPETARRIQRTRTYF